MVVANTTDRGPADMASSEDVDANKTKRELQLSTHHASSQALSRAPKRTRMTPESQDSFQPSFESIPAEMFCQILSYIGPTSSSLLALTQLNHYFHDTMKTIGDATLTRACAHFRVPLSPKTRIESSTSLFVRHARTCSRVLEELAELRGLLNRSERDVTNNDVKRAMDLALNLLEIGPSLSPTLERQILATCGKLGGRAFKYCKSRLLYSLGARVSDDVSPPTLRRRNEELTKNEERLDMSRLIMQIVVCRDWQLSKQHPTTLLDKKIPKQSDCKSSTLS